MIDLLAERKSWIHSRLDGLNPVEKVGRVVRVSGLLIESEGPDVAVGDICELKSGRKSESTMAEVVGFRDQTVLLMPLTDMGNIHPGCATVLAPGQNRIPVGNSTGFSNILYPVIINLSNELRTHIYCWLNLGFN